MTHLKTILPHVRNQLRKPAVVMAMAGAVLAPALGAAVVTNATASDRSDIAALTDASPVTGASAARLMGADVAGMGEGAWVHSVDVDRFGRPVAVTIEQHGMLGLRASRTTVDAEDMSFSPARKLVVMNERLG